MDATHVKTELPPNVPRALELEAWLVYGLTASDPKSRRLSLEEIAASGVGDSPELLQLVAKGAAGDPDPACRDLAIRILAAEKAKEQAMRLAGKIQLSPSSFKDLIEFADPNLRAALLKAIRKAPPEDLLDLWREQVLSESDPGVLEMGFSLLARFGRESDASFALSSLYSEHPGVVCAAIDLLHAQNLTMFREQVSHVLAAADLSIRLHAIRRLRSIDAHEASLFLHSMLSDPDPFVRQRALRELLLVPFQEAESLYMRYLSIEVTPLLLVVAGLSIAFNPHPELPVKVYDLFLVSRGLKKHIVQLIAGQVVETISQAGILTQPKNEYLTELKQKLAGRRDALMLKLTLRDLTNTDPEARRTAIERLRPQSRLPEVRKALVAARDGEADEELKALLGELIGDDQPATLEAFLEAVQTGGFFDHPPKLQRQFLGTITDGDRFRQARRSLKILFLGSPPRPIFLEILRLIGEFGDASDATDLLPLMQHPETPIVAAAIRACGLIDLDALLPVLNPLLQHEDPRIKTAALEVFLKTDKEGAVHYLHTMCRAPQTAIRRNALALMPLLDYPSAEPLLLEMLRVEKQSDVMEKVGMMIAANPTEEGMTALFRASRDDKGVLKPEFEELWETAVQTAIGILAPDRPALEARFAEAVQQEKVREEAPKPSYSYKNIAPKHAMPSVSAMSEIPEMPSGESGSPDKFFAKLKQNFEQHKSSILVACVILSPLLYLYFYGIGDSETIMGKPSSQSSQHSFLKSAGMDEGSKTLPSAIVGQPGNVSTFLSGPSYASVIQSADKEADKFRGEFKVANEKAFRDMLLEMSQDQNYKGYAEFFLNDNCKNGMALVESGKLEEGKDYLLKALTDPNVSEEAKLIVCGTLFGVGFETGDKDAILKAYEKLFSTISPNDLPPGYDIMKVREQFSQLGRINDIKPEQFQMIIEKIGKDVPGFTPDMKQKYLEGFRNMQQRFGK